MQGQRIWGILLCISVRFALAGGIDGRGDQVTGANPDCRVYFDRALPTPSLSGVLHGVGQKDPPDERIRGIHPALWRGDPAFMDRVERFGARFVVLMQEGYGYPPGYNGNGPPWQNWSFYEASVRKLVDAYPDRGAVWEPWNEPDFPQFWTGTLEQYHELYARAYRIIRQRLGPTVAVAGPCFAFETPEKIRSFLEACLTRGVEVNVLSLHLLQLDNDIAQVESRLKEVKRLFVRNPRFQPLKIRQVHVNEIIGSTAFLHPGDNLAYLHFAERGGADAACRACWKDSSGAESCFDCSLAGLVQPRTFLPRSVWWAYNAYGTGVQTRVFTQVLSKNLAVLASTHGMYGDAPQILVARFGAGSGAIAPEVEVRGIGALVPSSPARWKARTYRLPDSGEAALDQPVLIETKVVNRTGDALTLRLPPIAIHEALIIRFDPEQ